MYSIFPPFFFTFFLIQRNSMESIIIQSNPEKSNGTQWTRFQNQTLKEICWINFKQSARSTCDIIVTVWQHYQTPAIDTQPPPTHRNLAPEYEELNFKSTTCDINSAIATVIGECHWDGSSYQSRPLIPCYHLHRRSL